MDPPEAYARNSIDLDPNATAAQNFSFPDEQIESRLNRAALFGLIWWGWFLLAVITAVYLDNTRVYDENGAWRWANQTGWGIALIIVVCIPGFMAPLGSTFLGWIGTAQIRRSRGRQYGLKLALAQGLALPLLTIPIALLGLLVMGASLGGESAGISGLFILLVGAVGMLATSFIGARLISRMAATPDRSH